MSGKVFNAGRMVVAAVSFGVLAAAVAQAETPAQQHLHAREQAQQQGISEAELLAAKVGNGVTRLRDGREEWKAIFDRIYELGQIKSVTRNDSAVIERVGSVTKARLNEEGRVIPPSGFAGGAIDLRFSMDKWSYGFAVEQPAKNGKTLRSLQFFDQSGAAVIKIYLDNESGLPAFNKLVADFKGAQQPEKLNVSAPKSRPAHKSTADADVKELRLAWSELTDVHQFARLVKDLDITREQSLELIGTDSAYRLAPAAIETLFTEASKQGQPVLVFVSNPGMIQIYGGKADKTAVVGDWFQVQAPDLKLALLRANIDRGWVVKRPAKDGMITSVEFYDKKGDQIINIFSRRERNKEESAVWRKIVAGLERSS